MKLKPVQCTAALMLLLSFVWINLAQAQSLDAEVCVFAAPLTDDLKRLNKAKQSCLQPLPSILAIGDETQRHLWWHYSGLDNIPQPSVLSLSDFVYNSGMLILRYADGTVERIKLSPATAAAYKTPYQQYRFSVGTGAQQLQEIYLGLDLRYDPNLVNINIEAPADTAIRDYQYWMIVGLVLGVQLAMLVYNLVLAVQFRFNFHITYCCLGVVAIGYNFLLLGGDILLIPQADSNMMLYLRYISIGSLFLFSVLFIVSFLEQWAMARSAKIVAVSLAVLGFSIALFSFLAVFSPYPEWGYNRYTMGAFNLVVGVETLVIVYAIAASIVKGSRAGIFILLAWAPMIAAVVYRLAITSGVADLSLLTELSIPISSSLEMVILSLGIVDRLNSIRVERDNAKAANEELLVVSHTDPLTGTGNRRYLTNQVEKIEQAPEFVHSQLALILFDIDRFKHINDTWGHEAGDTVLVELVKQVKLISRSQEIFARIGGEEFALLLPNSSKDTAMAMAQRVRLSVEAISLSRLAPVQQPVTVSLGVAVAPLTDQVYQRLYQQADRALYAAKNTGRNKAVLYDDVMEQEDSPLPA